VKNPAGEPLPDPAWRAELARRLAVYRTRRRKPAPDAAQAGLPFDAVPELPASPAVAVEEGPTEKPASEDFAFTLAIGRALPVSDPHEDARWEIDVSRPEGEPPAFLESSGGEFRLSPVAPLAERRFAAFLDLLFLLFAYGGFLALFSSLGGEFTLSKLSAAVYGATLALFYLQYFALFTILGGTTPGMMFRGIEVISLSGEAPSPRQLLARSAGYILSAGSLFLGFLWAFWDDDQLTWHDRISHTYLTMRRGAARSGAHGLIRDH